MLRGQRALVLHLALVALALLCAACTIHVETTSAPPPPERLVKAPRPARRSHARRRAPPPVSPALPPTASARPAPAPLHVDPPRPDPEASKLFLTNIGQGAIELLPMTSPPRVLALGLEASAAGEAPRMTADGAPRGAMLKEGERGRMALAISGDACLTFIAQGGLGVIEVDLFLTTGTSTNLRVVAQDERDGPVAVLGGKAGCVTLHGPVSSDLYVQLRKGEGRVLVQAYRR